MIKNRQQDYYRLLGEADKQADCSAFIEFLLQSIQESLHEAIASQNYPETRVETSKVKTEDRILEVLEIQPELSLAEVATTIGRSVSAVERAATKLKSQNRLAYEGSKKDGKWNVLRWSNFDIIFRWDQ